MASILEYVGPVDLIHVARSCQFLREMVYEDTRWVRRLKQIGCWNELEAREQTEHYIMAKKGRPTGPSVQTYIATPSRTRLGIQDARQSTSSPMDKAEATTAHLPGKSNDPLTVLQNVRSIRGKGREQYGKVHAALGPFYNNLVNSEASTEALVFKKYPDPQQQACLLANILSFAKSDTTTEGVDKENRLLVAIDSFESAALKEFRTGYENGDIKGLMQKYAHVLMSLNGGGSAMDIFIHNNHLISQKSAFGNPLEGVDRDTGIVALEHTQEFFTRLGAKLKDEVSVMNQCFPSSPGLENRFLEMIDTKVVSPYFTELFDEIHNKNILSYLNTVSATVVQTLSFLRKMKQVHTAVNKDPSFETRIAQSIFEGHLQQYLSDELDYCQQYCNTAVVEWDRKLSEQEASTESFYMSNINRQADKKDFIASFKKVLMAPVNIFPTLKSSNSKSGESLANGVPESGKPSIDSAISPDVPIQSFLSSSLPVEIPTTELAARTAIMNSRLESIRSLFSMDLALNLVQTTKASLERAAPFVKFGAPYGKIAQQQCEALFVSLLYSLGQHHVIAGFDKALGHLAAYQSRNKGDHNVSGVDSLMKFLELVNVGDLILQMVEAFYEQELISTQLTDSNDFLAPPVKAKKKLEQMLDERVAAGLNKGIDVLMDEVEYILITKQPMSDFNPEAISPNPGMATVVDVGPSEAAQEVTKIVSSHMRMLIGSTDKSTLDVFNQEVGLRLFGVLCKHIKRQRISVVGSIKLIRYNICSNKSFFH